mmetsp:Transcript_8027/g.18710  ORF Transcript_8027/g.18710 Transcript_8027/m.18710 type:complete len:902 (+) Transcript_8027:29-2734(+)
MPEQAVNEERPQRPGRPLSPSLRGHFDTWQGQAQWDEGRRRPFMEGTSRPSTSPAAGNETGPRGAETIRPAHPWTSAPLASVKSFASGCLPSDSWNDLFAPDSWSMTALTQPEHNDRTDAIAHGLVSRARTSCSEYRIFKREDDVRAFHGLWSTMSFRRPRGMDVICEQARVARKPPARIASGFVSKGPSGQTAHDIVKDVPLIKQIEEQTPGFANLLAEMDALSFVSTLAGQVLYREADPVRCAYVLCSGSVHFLSFDREFLRKSGWHPVDHGDDSASKLKKSTSSLAAMTPRDDYDPADFLPLAEYAQKARRGQDHTRFRTLEGYSTFNKDSSYGESYSSSTAVGSLIGEPALVGKDVWQHTAKCIKDCDLLAIDAGIFKQAVKTMRENRRFFDLYMPGLNKNKNLKPHPNDFFKREHVPEGETLLEEGVVPLEPAVFMVQHGKVELKRFQMSSGNPAYVLSARPLTGKPSKVTTKEVTCLLLPEIARTFAEDLDEEGLPRIGLPPPLKGSMRQILEDQYWADPTNFLPPRGTPLSPEEAKVRNHKALLKERMETTASRKKERALRREEEAREVRPKQDSPTNPRSEEEIQKIQELLQHVSHLCSARPGSPEYVGPDDCWSERPERHWLSRDTLCGPFSRPTSAKMILDEELRRGLPQNQETIATLKTGDLFCSLSFFPIWGVPEPFSAVAASPDCTVVYVRGAREAKAIPKVLLKELRVELALCLERRLKTVVEMSAKSFSKDSANSGDAAKEPSPFLGETVETALDQAEAGIQLEEHSDTSPSRLGTESRGVAQASLTLPIPRRPSFHSSHSNRSLRSQQRSTTGTSERSPSKGSSGRSGPISSAPYFNSFEEDGQVFRKRRKRQKPVSFVRWLFFGKGQPQTQRQQQARRSMVGSG